MAYYPLASATKKAEPRTKFAGIENSTLFRLGRLCGTVFLGALILARPELGSEYQNAGWLLILAWAPFGLVLDLWSAPAQRLPVQACVDLLAVVVCSAMLPDVWISGLVFGALIVGGTVPRFAYGYKLVSVLLPTVFVVAMAGIAWHHQLGDALFPLLSMTFGVPFCFLYALKELRREQELRDRANVMESLTRIAGGIGHDFNNILTGIQGNAELAELKLDRNHVARPFLQALLAESQKAQLFSTQLLAFSGGVVSGRSRLDLRAELHGIASLLESALPRGVRLQIETQTELPLVNGNRGQLQELLVASVLHVADALERRPSGVQVALRKVERRHADELVIQVRASSSASSTLSHSAGAQQQRDGKHFSMAIARRVLREHGGEIQVHGDWRTGVVMTLRLPGLPATNTKAVRPSAPAPTVPRHVVLLETAPGVRAVGESLLQELGHKVVSTISEEEVLEILARDTRVEAVLLDIVVADSEVLLDRIEACRPGLPVLVSDSSVLDGDARGSLSFVAKPYSSASLNSAITRALAAAAGNKKTAPGRKS